MQFFSAFGYGLHYLNVSWSQLQVRAVSFMHGANRKAIAPYCGSRYVQLTREMIKQQGRERAHTVVSVLAHAQL